MDAMHFWLNRETEHFESECRSNAQRLRLATTMRQVRDLGRVHARSEISYMPGARNAKSRLHQAAGNRMQALMDDDLATLRKIEDPEEFIKRSGQMRQMDWVFLRGDYANVLVAGEREMQRIKYALDKKLENKAATSGDIAIDEPAAKSTSRLTRP